MVKEQLDQASEAILARDATATVRLLNQLVRSRLDAWREEILLPSEVLAEVRAPDIEGPVREAGLFFARRQGEGTYADKALEILAAPDLEGDPDAAHLRAQIRDVLTQESEDSHAADRLEVIADYRYALSLTGGSAQKDRARVRVGQILAELRFFPEATAALRPLLKRKLREPYNRAARVSFAETAYLADNPKTAIDSILEFELDRLSPELRRWTIRRTADSLYKLGNFKSAILAYSRLIEEARLFRELAAQQPAAAPIDPLVRLRLVAALLEVGRSKEALIEIKRVLETDAVDEHLMTLAGLFLARALRENEEFRSASAVAAEITRSVPDAEETALAAVDFMESRRLSGVRHPKVPPDALKFRKRKPNAPGFALLAYVLASDRPDGSSAKQIRTKLGKLLRELPNGPVRVRVRSDLTLRIQSHLRAVYLGEETLDPQVVQDVVQYLRPSQIDQDALLLALQAFHETGDWENCKRWGATLYRSDARPIRRGLGAWRNARCKLLKNPALVSARSLLRYADDGKSGPFALALAALAAEKMLEKGQLDLAARTYESALQSVAEPRLVGPALLRAGELHVHLGDPKLGTWRILRGLTMTDARALTNDPFRKAGLVALGLGARQARERRRNEATASLRRERQRAEPWWEPAYAYLGYRTGPGRPPRGDDIFSRVSQEMQEIDALAKRVESIVGSEELKLRLGDGG